ncbi:MAG: DUF1152 domain-containing protein [Solirubrobacteraceae bacterium]
MYAKRAPLYVAAGGGGDVLGALMVALTAGSMPASTHIATFAWERKRFDPQPGPRGARDFVNLHARQEGVHEVDGQTRLRAGRSFLPDLARETGCKIYLLDPTDGVVGLRRQLGALADYLDASETLVVDVGGDILARGKEPGLRSPTADAMALAASGEVGRDTWILTLGLGLDGELSRAQWQAACRAGAQATETELYLGPEAAGFVRELLDWHPSEVAGLACLAALGYHGTAELRADGLRVKVDRHAAVVHRFEHSWVLARNRIAGALQNTSSLEGIEAVVRATTGRSELDDERRMLAHGNAYLTRHLHRHELERLEDELMAYSAQAAASHVSFLTLRRVSELLRLAPAPFEQLRGYLAARHPGRVQPPVWRCDISEKALEFRS